LPAIWRTGSKTTAWITSTVHCSILSPRGKIERWHQTLKNRILLANYYLPGALEQAIGDFVAHYNHRRYHESIANLTPADVYFGRGQTILLERERIKRDTIKARRLHHRGHAA
jgi:transposase InsO family protein